MSEGTRRDASNSESSSSERVRALHRVGRGTSHSHGRAQLFVAVGELVMVTVILPPYAFRGVRRGSGGGDVKASPRMRRSHSARSLSSTPAVIGYEGCGMTF